VFRRRISAVADRGASSLIEKETNEHSPAMHSALGWCKHGYINHMVKLASHRFQGIAGRSNTEKMNIEHRTSNIEFLMKKR
jgi:hypothetical protein